MQTHAEPGRYSIFHLTRRDGTAFFLHPFVRRGSFLELSAGAKLSGYYGAEPRVESLTMLRNELYRRIDEDVRDWINERRFIPRFLISSLAFLIVFLFMSLVVHTPIPLADELIASTAAAVLVYVLVGRWFEQSRSAAQRRMTLRKQVDEVIFTEAEFVRELEEILRRLEGAEPTLASLTGGRDVQQLWNRSGESTGRVLDLLRQLLNLKPWKQAAREVKRGRISGRTLDALEEKGADPSLILLYHELNRSSRQE